MRFRADVLISQAMTQGRNWSERAAVFGPNEEITELQAKTESVAQEFALRALQYSESAISFAVGHLMDGDSRMEPSSMRKVLKENIADACSGKKGFQSSDIQKCLWDAANKF